MTKLYPRIHLTSEMEVIHLECPMSICYAKDSSVYNVVSTCSYGFTIDPVKQQKAWKKVQQEGMDKHSWDIHEGKRYFLDNSFDFRIESVGVYSNKHIVQLGCQLITKHLKTYLKYVQDRSLKIEDGKTV